MINLEKTRELVNPAKIISSTEIAIAQPVTPTPQNKKTEKTKKKPEKDIKKPSIELVYAWSIKNMGKYSSKSEGACRSLYEWQGNCWTRLTDSDGHVEAWHWLSQNAPSYASKSKASSLHESALLALPPLPKNPTGNVIPMANYWLRVTDDNRLRIYLPNKNEGITYHIKASLGIKQGAEFYEPKPVPVDSYFGRFIEVSLPDITVRQLVQEYLGYTLLNDTRFQTAQVWVGDGSNGKSVLLKLISELHAKVGAIALDDLKGFGLAPVVDSSLLISAETPKRGINEQELKKIVTGDPMNVAYKFKDMFTHSPTAKVLIACNRFPHIQDESNGVWRRLQIVRWGINIPKAEQIPNLDNLIIKKELALVVDWCLEGLLRLLARGDFDEPESVVVRKNEEKRNSNSVLTFIEDYGLHLIPECETSKKQLHGIYETFCEENCLSSFGGSEFWKKIRQAFPNIQDKKGGTKSKRIWYVNLGIGTFCDPADNNETPFD